jgi:hypothetical protein
MGKQESLYASDSIPVRHHVHCYFQKEPWD